jgi:thiol-disulfide isomerase/thioredoxin
MKKFFALLLLLVALPVFSQITVEGTVTDANGKAPLLAHAHIGAYNDMVGSSATQCSADGHYRVMVPKSGIYSLRFSAVNHEEISIPLIVDDADKHISINVHLRANPFVKEPDKITVIGDWNKFKFASDAQMTMKTASDGKKTFTYEREATGDTMSYQLIGIVGGGHSVNGTAADYFTYDGGGDYRSVIKTHKGDKVTITFDPSALNYGNDPKLPVVEIENISVKKVYELTEIIRKTEEEFQHGGGANGVPAEKYKTLLGNIKQVYDGAVKAGDKKFSQIAAVMMAKEFDPDQDFGAENAVLILTSVPPESPLWVIAPNEISAITMLADKKTGQTYRNGLKNNPQRTVRAVTIGDEMLRDVEAKDITGWKKNYAILKKDYADVPEVKWTLVQNNPDAVVQIGKSVPDFEVALLDGSGKISNVSMLGKYYMMDFWATWCGPCVREMPAIHKAYDRFKGRKGFEILSLSMDAKQEHIAPFREKKWKMPWLHAFIPGVFEAELAKKFEVAGIPKPVLVGPDGKVVAMQEELRGESLEKTLAKYLGENN